MNRVVKRKTKNICQACGNESLKWMGKCPGCHNWNTMVEELDTKSTISGQPLNRRAGYGSKPEKINAIETQKDPRIMTAMNELNRVLGGGIVPGSLVLIGGDPGIGKSTLLLQVSSQLAEKQMTVLYVYGEESTRKTKLRDDRL